MYFASHGYALYHLWGGDPVFLVLMPSVPPNLPSQQLTLF